jgi:hypothetical protein
MVARLESSIGHAHANPTLDLDVHGRRIVLV